MYMYMDIINTIDKAVVTINVGGGGAYPNDIQLVWGLTFTIPLRKISINTSSVSCGIPISSSVCCNRYDSNRCNTSIATSLRPPSKPELRSIKKNYSMSSMDHSASRLLFDYSLF